MRSRLPCDCSELMLSEGDCFHGELKYVRTLSDMTVIAENIQGHIRLMLPYEVKQENT